MTISTLKDYINLMRRQRLILFLSSFLVFVEISIAATPTHQTLEIPSDEASPPKTPPPYHPTHQLQDQGLEISKNPSDVFNPSFHLKPSPSFTIAGHSAYNIKTEKMETWFGLHVAPWMTATHRIQLGLDVHSRFAWTHIAYHNLLSRTQKRFYWGGGVSTVADSQEDLRSFLEFENYFAFVAGGWELQLQPEYNLRVEVSYHQSTELGYARGTLGLTKSF